MAKSKRSAIEITPGRIAAAVGILAMTLLTFASCGPIDFDGHHLLMNEIDAEDVTADMPFGSLMGSAAEKTRDVPLKDSKPIFEGRDAWLHYVYICAFALAVLALLLPLRTHMAVGIAGLVLTVVFMFGFKSVVEGRPDTGSTAEAPFDLGALQPKLEFEVGAWLTLAAFGAVGVTGFQQRKR